MSPLTNQCRDETGSCLNSLRSETILRRDHDNALAQKVVDLWRGDIAVISSAKSTAVEHEHDI